MQCVEFENRLNHLLDQRLSPAIDIVLAEHAQSCAGCSELLAAHEALLEGIATLPVVRLGDAKRQALADRVIGGVMAEAGSEPTELFQARSFLHAERKSVAAVREVELAADRPAIVASNPAGPWAAVGIVLAIAAAVLIAVLPWFRGEQQPPAPPGRNQLIVEKHNEEPVLQEYEDLELIARVGYQVADGLTPVTNSMVSALRELRKRPLFRGADTQGRSSSYYLPRDAAEITAVA